MRIRRILHRRSVAVALFVLVAGVTAHAELKYTMTMDMRPLQNAAPVPPAMAMMGEMMKSAMFPDGSYEATFLVGPRGTRLENSKGNAVVPAGMIQLFKPDGSGAVLNPVAKTYWTLPLRPQDMAAAMKMLSPKVTTKRTGEFATIAGLRAERVAVQITMALPPPLQSSAGVSELVTNGEMWITDRFKSYVTAGYGGATQLLEAMGVGNLDGFPLRVVMRGGSLGNYEQISEVTKIAEEAADASLFEIPAGYTEVASPLPQMGMPSPTPGGR